MMAKLKLIASDYDGTLNSDGIAEHVRRALIDWRVAGNQFGIVSGRGMSNLIRMIQNDEVICDFLIANNGAVIADGEGKVLVYHTKDAFLCREIISFVLDNGAQYATVCFAESEFYVVSEEHKARRADDMRYFTRATYEPREFTQISTVCADRPEAMRLANEINRQFFEKVTALVNGRCIDIVPYGVDKAAGICELCALWEINIDAVRTVGDNYNDEAMLRSFCSYAVENAVEDIKKIATYVVRDIAELCQRETVE